MDALQALHGRVSVPRLVGPPPSASECEAIFRAALRAPDHAYLRPWRFLVIQGEGLQRLGDLFAGAMLADTPDLAAEVLARYQSLPLRAPMVIVCITSPSEHPKVPLVEQQAACAVAVGNMLIAAHALGLGAVWRTGDLAYHPGIRRGLGLNESEQIAAYLYLGQSAGERKSVPELDPADFFSHWPPG